MKIALGADHRGFKLKEALRKRLAAGGHQVADCGTDSEAAADYPDFAHEVARKVAVGEVERGIMVCGSGVGASVAANKIPGARAAICHDTFSARQGVADDDVNVLCLGAGVIGPNLADEIVDVWLKARFSQAARHTRRRNKVLELEKRYGKTNG